MIMNGTPMPDGFPPDPPVSCAEAVAEASLKGAAMVAEHGTTQLWANPAGAWQICDSFSSQDGGQPTLLARHRAGEAYLPDRHSLAISTNVDNDGKVQLFAAGKPFDGVDSIDYTFADGHTESAVFQGGMWAMEYDLTLTADNRVPAAGPVTVDWSGPAGSGGITLKWPADTCAQTNHGC